MRAYSWLLLIVLIPLPVIAEQPQRMVAVHAARMLEVWSGELLRDVTVLSRDGLIEAVGSGIEVPAAAERIELGEVTLLPGLIDCHTHIMARVADGPDGYIVMLATKSQPYRALEGAANASQTLRAGFTSIRDVESEGAGYADVALRDAINEGLVEGPRMQAATRAIAAVGRYFPFGIAPDVEKFPQGAQMVSGVEEVRRAAREQLGQGADLIKIYADWHRPTFTVEELRAAVDEAHKRGKKVAAHADSAEGIANALAAGVDSIEHGCYLDATLLQLIKDKGVYWVPTRAAFAAQLPRLKGNPRGLKMVEGIVAKGRENLAAAQKLGVKLAMGSDPGSAAEHGDNARELVELVRLGLPPLEAIRAATVNAAALMGWSEQVGVVEKGHFADLIAVSGDPLADIGELGRVKFVMKGGVVVKREPGK